MLNPIRRVASDASAPPRYEDSPYVCPAILDHNKPLSTRTYYQAWLRLLDRASVPKVGAHGIRHRSAPDIANSGAPIEIGTALMAHKTVAVFMRYAHTEDDPVRQAAGLVANRRQTITGARRKPQEATA
ncbi:integrase [Pandoraea commovens]|uniref:Integrase n=1 Tax=Pandoraea commovens TaxID=2508289 RepID=A0A5E4W9I6_9BURK|nr:integrase [Pandoraea commovens]